MGRLIVYKFTSQATPTPATPPSALQGQGRLSPMGRPALPLPSPSKLSQRRAKIPSELSLPSRTRTNAVDMIKKAKARRAAESKTSTVQHPEAARSPTIDRRRAAVSPQTFMAPQPKLVEYASWRLQVSPAVPRWATSETVLESLGNFDVTQAPRSLRARFASVAERSGAKQPEPETKRKRLALETSPPAATLDDASLANLVTTLRAITRLLEDPPRLPLFPTHVADQILAELREEYDRTRYQLSDTGMRGSRSFDSGLPLGESEVNADDPAVLVAHMKTLKDAARWVLGQKRESAERETRAVVDLLDQRNRAVLRLIAARAK